MRHYKIYVKQYNSIIVFSGGLRAQQSVDITVTGETYAMAASQIHTFLCAEVTLSCVSCVSCTHTAVSEDWQDVWFVGQRGDLLWMKRHLPSSLDSDLWVEGKYSRSRSARPAAKSIITVDVFPPLARQQQFLYAEYPWVCVLWFEVFKKNNEGFKWNKPAHSRLVRTCSLVALFRSVKAAFWNRLSDKRGRRKLLPWSGLVYNIK